MRLAVNSQFTEQLSCKGGRRSRGKGSSAASHLPRGGHPSGTIRKPFKDKTDEKSNEMWVKPDRREAGKQPGVRCKEASGRLLIDTDTQSA